MVKLAVWDSRLVGCSRFGALDWLLLQAGDLHIAMVLSWISSISEFHDHGPSILSATRPGFDCTTT